MCGRATVVNPDGITEKVYGFTKKFVPSDWKPRYNLNPREEIPAVYYDPFLRQRVLRTMHWNLIPSSVGDKEKANAFDSSTRRSTRGSKQWLQREFSAMPGARNAVSSSSTE